MSLLGILKSLFGSAAAPSADAANTDDCDTVLQLPRTNVIEKDAPAPDEPAAPWWAPVAEPAATTEAPQEIDATLHGELTAALDDPDLDLPQLPEVAQNVLLILSSPDGDMRRASEVAARDPVLAANVLRVANSVAFRGVREVARLDQAFARLGQRALRGLLMTAIVKDVAIRVGAAQRTVGEELWRCAWASGIILGRLSRRFGLNEDDAFLAGLLHDIGKLAILRVSHDYQRRGKGRLTRPLFDRLCQEWHEHLGLRVAESWNLPDPLPQLVGNHHAPPAADDPLRTQRLLLQFADAVCVLLEYAPYRPVRLLELPCATGLGLMADDEVTREMLEELPDLVSAKMSAL